MKIALDYKRLRKCRTSFLHYPFGSLDLRRPTNNTGFATTDTRALLADTKAPTRQEARSLLFFTSNAGYL